MLVKLKQRRFDWFKDCLIGGMAITLVSMGVCLNTIVDNGNLSTVASALLIQPTLTAQAATPYQIELEHLKTVMQATEHIYRAAQAQKWQRANHHIAELKAELQSLKSDSSLSNTTLSFMEEQANQLATLATDKHSTRMMQMANQLSFDAVQLIHYRAPNKQIIGPLLTFYGRNLEFQTASHNRLVEQKLVEDIGFTWDAWKHNIHGYGTRGSTAQQLDELVAQLKQIASEQSYDSLAPKIVAAAQKLTIG